MIAYIVWLLGEIVRLVIVFGLIFIVFLAMSYWRRAKRVQGEK